MKQWEYLEVGLDYSKGRWRDSLGREGALVGSWSAWTHSGGLLNDLGRQGWELVGVEAYPNTSGGSSYGSGARAAKWIFKRPSSQGTGT